MSKRKWETFRQGETVEDKPEEEVGLFTQEGSDPFVYCGGYTSQILLMKFLRQKFSEETQGEKVSERTLENGWELSKSK